MDGHLITHIHTHTQRQDRDGGRWGDRERKEINRCISYKTPDSNYLKLMEKIKGDFLGVYISGVFFHLFPFIKCMHWYYNSKTALNRNETKIMQTVQNYENILRLILG